MCIVEDSYVSIKYEKNFRWLRSGGTEGNLPDQDGGDNHHAHEHHHHHDNGNDGNDGHDGHESHLTNA